MVEGVGMRRYEHAVVIVLAAIFLIMCVLAAGVVTSLVKENNLLTEENHMLKNALADLGAEIEEMSSQIDNLIYDLNRGIEWNKDARH
jgi:predicted PurR-regulated permease PerM